MSNDYKVALPRVNSADVSKPFAAGFSGPIDLRAQTNLPTYCAQRVIVTNNDISPTVIDDKTAGVGVTNNSVPPVAQDFVYKDIKGNTTTIKVPQQQTLIIDCAVSSLEAGSGANISVVAYWWLDSTTKFN